jgi:UDP-N-acetylmuramoylalanine--D-glutamate ligase
MGLGRFGGGIGVTRWLVEQGADVLVTDLAKTDELADSLGKIRDLIDGGAVEVRLGEHNVSDFTRCDLVVASPAVPHPWDNRFLRAAEAGGVPIMTEIRLLVERLPSRVRTIGITGSAGKSTTTAMIAHTLRAQGKTIHAGGNLGGSMLGLLGAIGAADWVVLELSSFMLYWLDEGVGFRSAPGWSPSIAVLTNLTDNHTDWHGSFGHYARCKANIVAHQQGEATDSFVYHAESRDLVARHFGRFLEERTEPICLDPREPWPEVIAPPHLRVPGSHNQANARLATRAAAVALLRDAGERWADASPEARAEAEGRCARALESYEPLPHRLQLVAEWDGPQGRARDGRRIRFYNDSKSTTPESALQALEAIASDEGMSPERIHLIAGGYDKGADLRPVAQAARRLAGLYTIGVTGPALAAAAPKEAAVFPCVTLEKAVEAAMRRLRPGDVLLLSPACASWDQFTNFEERGARFVQLVQERIGGTLAATAGGRA